MYFFVVVYDSSAVVVHSLKGILFYSSWKINVDYGYVNIMIPVYAFDNCNLLLS